MASFHSQLLSKALELYPSLTVEDLKPYLFRSRSTNAYDAVNLLARSVGVALDHASGEDCANSSQIQSALEKIYMVCISRVFLAASIWIEMCLEILVKFNGTTS